jgi:Ca-activated chloride channel family protein
MMSFEAPHYLHYAWALPLLAAGYLLGRHLTARAVAAAGAVRPAAGRSAARLRLGLRLLALAALVLALAKPQPARLAGPAPAPPATKLVFVVDVSTSMLAADVLPDRLTQAKKVVAEAVRELPGVEIGLVVFAGSAQLAMPLTTDYNAVSQACMALAPGVVARQGTSLAGALALAGQVLAASPAQGRTLCVLSDGESHTQGYEGVADSLRRAGIDLFAIGIGTPEGGTMLVGNGLNGSPVLKADARGQPIRSRLHESALRRLVQNRADRYIRLDTWRPATAQLLREVRGLGPPSTPPGRAGRLAYWQLCLLGAFGLLLLELAVPIRQSI